MSQTPLQFTDLSLQHSLSRYAAARRHRGGTDQSTLRKVMREWLFEAWERIPEGNKPGIRANLMRIITTYARATKGRKSKAQDEMKGTLAAKVIWMLDYKGARKLKGAAFYRMAKRFLNMRMFSANMHRAGLFKGFDLVHGRPPGRSGPKYKKHPIGDANESIGNQVSEILVENWASAKNGWGIAGIAGGAFEDSAAAIAEKFRRYAIADELQNAQKHGVPLVFA